MISHFKNIDTNIVKLGQEVKLKSDCCVITPKALVEDIIYLPPKCELEVDGHKKTIHKGYFLNVREYYLNQHPKNEVKLMHQANVLVFKMKEISQDEKIANQLKFFFIKVLSQQSYFDELSFE